MSAVPWHPPRENCGALAEPRFRGDGQLADLFRTRRRELLGQALLGRGELLGWVLRRQETHFPILRGIEWLRDLYADIGYRLEATFSRLSASELATLTLTQADCVEVRGVRLPFIADCEVLQLELPAPASTMIKQLPNLASRRHEIDEVLGASNLTLDVPYRTVDGPNGRPFIAGRDTATLEALAGIAHELGHCLYERQSAPSSFARQLDSERVAHEFEEDIVRSYLEFNGLGTELTRWKAYQRSVDAMNFHFFFDERVRLYGKPETYMATCDGSLFSRAATVFRESMFTLPGYQVVYAYASLGRVNRWLGVGS